ncbi:circadian clock protein KaiC [Magnetococcales bacterium HHB-1]
MSDLQKRLSDSKIPTGIQGLDLITSGGIFKGRSTLIVGSSGSGKTLLSLDILYHYLSQKESSGIFVTMEEEINDIIFNGQSMGWELDTLVAQNKLMFIDASPNLEETKEIGPINFDGILLQIQEAVNQTGAKLVVIDSIGSLFSQFSDSTIIRREIGKIIQRLKKMNITALMTSERTTEYGPISRHGIEEFVSDNVIILRNVLHDERARRTLQVLKMRGSPHETGEFPFTISEDGLQFSPLSGQQLKQPSSTIRISSGNNKLDDMVDGGLFKDSMILVSGPTGGGKTLLSMSFAASGCQNGERVLILAYEESQPQLLRNAQAWGFDFEKWVKSGQLKIICLYPESTPLEHHLLLIQKTVKEFRPHRLVMDSVSALERIADIRNFREFVIGLTSFCKQMEVCSLFTSTTPRLSGGDSITEAHISTITDIIILLRYVEVDGFMRRGIAIIKMRGSQHTKQIHEFIIDSTGLHIGEPFRNIQNIILGIPTPAVTSELDRLEAIFEKGADA